MKKTVLLALLLLCLLALCAGLSEETVKEGDTVFFGSYRLRGENAPAEPVPWKVLKTEDGYALLSCNYVLANHEYGTGSDDWENSSLNQFMSRTLKNELFTQAERSALRPDEVSFISAFAVSKDDTALELMLPSGKKTMLPKGAEALILVKNIRKGYTRVEYTDGETTLTGDIKSTSIKTIKRRVTVRSALFLLSKEQIAGLPAYEYSFMSAEGASKASYWITNDGLTDKTHLAMRPGGSTDSPSKTSTKVGVRPAAWVSVDALTTGGPQQERVEGLQTGDTVLFGRYSLSGSKNPAEDVSWRVLSIVDGYALLSCDYALCNHEIGNQADVWDNCSLNRFLCTELRKELFSEEELSALRPDELTYMVDTVTISTEGGKGATMKLISGKNKTVPEGAKVEIAQKGENGITRIMYLTGGKLYTGDIKSSCLKITRRKAVVTGGLILLSKEDILNHPAYEYPYKPGPGTSHTQYWLADEGTGNGTQLVMKTGGETAPVRKTATSVGVRPAVWVNAEALTKIVGHAQVAASIKEKVYVSGTAKAGDSVLYGSYRLNGRTKPASDISWKVLEVRDDYALLLCDFILADHVYGEAKNDWDSSSLKAYLSYELKNELLSAEEREALKPESVTYISHYMTAEAGTQLKLVNGKKMTISEKSEVEIMQSNVSKGYTRIKYTKGSKTYIGDVKNSALKTAGRKHTVKNGLILLGEEEIKAFAEYEYAYRTANGTAGTYYWIMDGESGEANHAVMLENGVTMTVAKTAAAGVRPAAWVRLDALDRVAAGE